MSARTAAWALVLVLPGLLHAARAQQEETPGAAGAAVSRVPPDVYEERLKQQLTPLAEVHAIAKPPIDPGGGKHTETLLDETIVYVREDGSEITVAHQIRQALTEAGVKQLAEDALYYRPSTTRIHLVVGQTIRADGTTVPVEEKGAFIKRPGNEQANLHSDYEELRVVFPGVTVGAIVEHVAVWDTFTPTMPGTFLHSQIWGNLGPTRRQRIYFDMPEPMRARLQWRALGAAIKDPEERKDGENRVILQWSADRLPPVVLEPGGPPLRQVGPHIRMSTVADWNEFGSWFAGLLKEGASFSEEIAAKAKEWRGDATTPEETARRLSERVSADVRYTGLEFGKGAFQPRSPADVLATSYGDCKDKANLLRALLAECGIRSRLALLDSDHAGEIDRAIPSPGRFNHAILAIDLPGNDSPLWCDPTQEGVPIGLLAAGDADRDVLLIDEGGKVEWSHTPAQSLGKHDGSFEFQLEPGGGFSGWVTIEGEGVVPSRVQHVIAKSDRVTAVRRLAAIYCGEMKGVDVIDYESKKVDRPGKEPAMKLRMYLLKRGNSIDDKPASEQFRFPVFGMMKPNVGPKADRESALMGMVSEFRMRGTL